MLPPRTGLAGRVFLPDFLKILRSKSNFALSSIHFDEIASDFHEISLDVLELPFYSLRISLIFKIKKNMFPNFSTNSPNFPYMFSNFR